MKSVKRTSRNFLVPGCEQWKAIIVWNWPWRTASAALLAKAVLKTNICDCCCMYWASIVLDCLGIPAGAGIGCIPSGPMGPPIGPPIGPAIPELGPMPMPIGIPALPAHDGSETVSMFSVSHDPTSV